MQVTSQHSFHCDCSKDFSMLNIIIFFACLEYFYMQSVQFNPCKGYNSNSILRACWVKKEISLTQNFLKRCNNFVKMQRKILFLAQSISVKLNKILLKLRKLQGKAKRFWNIAATSYKILLIKNIFSFQRMFFFSICIKIFYSNWTITTICISGSKSNVQ